MNNTPGFENFLATESVQLPVWNFVTNLLLAALLAFLLSKVYERFGNALSNRRQFGGNFVLLAMTTMLIISVVKSSLALSLGLVGALSIVRFRAAIKEPEELAYLFLTIAIGLGLGADQQTVTIAAFLLISGAIALKGLARKSQDKKNLHLTLSGSDLDLAPIVSVLKKHCRAVDIKRVEEAENHLEASFLVSFDRFEDLETTKKDLRALAPTVHLLFLDALGLGDLG